MPPQDLSQFSAPIVRPRGVEQEAIALKRRRKAPTVPMPEYREGRRRKEVTAPMPILEGVEDL